MRKEETPLTINLIRSELKAPKARKNEFGKYNYRKLEDILIALKPLLLKYGALLSISDKLKFKEGRHYIVAKAILTCDGEKHESEGWAREPDSKPGMSSDQVTGSASSYARKYALNALFLIDDSVEPDSVEDGPIGKAEIDKIEELLKKTQADKTQFMLHYKVNAMKDMTKFQGADAIEKLESKL